ncbi:MAG: FAD-binding oxidoreductase [Candidatus Levyibacteriota bacterium]
MNPALIEELKTLIKGDVMTDEATLMQHSHDASLFEVKPQVVVFPKDDADVQALIKFVSKHKKEHPELSLTGRSAGTDMAGGSINDSIIVAFGKYFTKIGPIKDAVGTAQPGAFYRDFEKETLKQNWIFPSYPASRELCAIGGIVNNNSGGEKSLAYGKTEKYLKRVKVVLSDGKTYEFKALKRHELRAKMAQNDFEGELYTKIYKLIKRNYETLQAAKPHVSKNSAGYFLWNVWDREKDIFDMTQLWTGAQGTLGMLLEADLKLVPVHKHREMEIIFLHDMAHLGEIIDAVMPLKPESFESYDDNTLKLALRFFPEFAKQLGLGGLIESGLAFAPAFMQMFVGRLPKLILQIDFTGDDPEELKQKIATLREKLAPLHPQTKIAIEDQEKRYWLVRRESFNLLRNKIRDKHTAPFIDDFVIQPHQIAEVLPQITAVVQKHPEFIYTVAGHIGDGNFHIIPLVDITNPAARKAIPEISEEVYGIITKYKGSITGEHNDGLIRTPYLEQMYGKEVIKLFEEVKKAFDPHGIFNPRKKVHGDLTWAMNHIRTNWDTIKLPK